MTELEDPRVIDVLLVEVEIHVLGFQLVQDVDQVLERATEPIHGPGRDHIELSPSHALEQGIEAGALIPTLGA